MATHKGSFDAGDKTWDYETVEWKQEGGKPRVNIRESDLTNSGDLTVAIKDPEDPNFIAYQTIQLPWEGWEQIEYVLGIDWGEEGSRGR